MKIKHFNDFMAFIENHTFPGEEETPNWLKKENGGEGCGNEVSYQPFYFETYTFEVNKFFGDIRSIRLVCSETRKEILHIFAGQDFVLDHISDRREFMVFKKDVTDWLCLYECLPD